MGTLMPKIMVAAMKKIKIRNWVLRLVLELSVILIYQDFDSKDKFWIKKSFQLPYFYSYWLRPAWINPRQQ